MVDQNFLFYENTAVYALSILGNSNASENVLPVTCHAWNQTKTSTSTSTTTAAAATTTTAIIATTTIAIIATTTTAAAAALIATTITAEFSSARYGWQNLDQKLYFLLSWCIP